MRTDPFAFLVEIAILLAASGIQANCQTTHMSEEQLARQALVNLFAQLQAGQHDLAAKLCAGHYDVMIEHYPAIDPGDPN